MSKKSKAEVPEVIATEPDEVKRTKSEKKASAKRNGDRRKPHGLVLYLMWMMGILTVLFALNGILLIRTSHKVDKIDGIASGLTSPEGKQAQAKATTLVLARLLSAECRTRFYAERPANSLTVEEYVARCLSADLTTPITLPELPTTTTAPHR